LDHEGRFKGRWTVEAKYPALKVACQELATYMQTKHVMGGAIPAVWRSTGIAAIYPLPYLEMRARLSLHPATQAILAEYASPVVRSMDADVSDDALLADRTPQNTWLDEIEDGTIVTGGYDWDTSAKPPTFWDEKNVNARVNKWNAKWTAILTEINREEHAYRKLLLDRHGATLLYWPEPNIYMTATDRLEGAPALLEAVKPGAAQMRESLYYMSRHVPSGELAGKYDSHLKTTKPAKDDYFTDLKALIKQTRKPSEEEVRKVVREIRQTHLGANWTSDIQKWHGAQAPIESSAVEAERVAAVNRVAAQIQTILAM
jgi:hypothetical protein